MGKTEADGEISQGNTVAELVMKHKYLALSIYFAIYSKVFGQVLMLCFRLIKILSTLSLPCANPKGP